MTIRQIVFSISGDNAALHSHIFVPRDLFIYRSNDLHPQNIRGHCGDKDEKVKKLKC